MQNESSSRLFYKLLIHSLLETLSPQGLSPLLTVKGKTDWTDWSQMFILKRGHLTSLWFTSRVSVSQPRIQESHALIIFNQKTSKTSPKTLLFPHNYRYRKENLQEMKISHIYDYVRFLLLYLLLFIEHGSLILSDRHSIFIIKTNETHSRILWGNFCKCQQNSDTFIGCTEIGQR